MEGILSDFIANHSLEEIVAGAPLDVQSIPAERRERVVAILLHCCINGPISPHKQTNFPIIGETSLDDECGFRVTNGTLKSSCEEVKEFLGQQGFSGGFMHSREGEFWPNSYDPSQ